MGREGFDVNDSDSLNSPANLPGTLVILEWNGAKGHSEDGGNELADILTRKCGTLVGDSAGGFQSQCFGALSVFTILSTSGPNRFCCAAGYSSVKFPIASSQSAICRM